MSDGSDQPKSSAPKSVNPFANPLSSTSGQTSNPFGASQLAGSSVPQPANPFGSPISSGTPAGSLNPFAAPAPAAPAASVNPFAGSAAPAPTAPTASVNPFAAAPASTSPDSSVNPFAEAASPNASVNPFAAPAINPAGSGSINPFAQPAVSTEASTENPFSLDTKASQAPVTNASEMTQAVEEGPSQDQLQQLNPFRMAAAQEPSADELQALAGDFKLSLVPKKTVITYAAGAGIGALIIGLLIGGLFSGRSEHAKRVVAWKQIDRSLTKPFAQLKQLETSINAIIEATQKQELAWDQVEAIPTTFVELDFSLLAPGVSMSQVAMIKLSALLLKMQNTFSKASIYRSTTLKDKGSITQILDKKDFAALPVHAIHVENFFNNCLKKGRSVCNSFDSLQRGSGRVVGLMSAKIIKGGKLNVITRDSNEAFDVNISDLVLVPRPDIVGSGMNALSIHNQSLNALKVELDSLLKTRNEFERILQEKRTLE